MRTRMYGGVRGRKTKVGGKPTFVSLLLDSSYPIYLRRVIIRKPLLLLSVLLLLLLQAGCM